MSDTPPRLTRLMAFRLVTSDAERLAAFYTQGIGCGFEGASTISPVEMQALGLAGGGVRWSLTLGEERIELDLYDRPGRPYPRDRNATDLIFQHFAIAVTDADAAYRRALLHGAVPISEGGPVTLPASAGGVTAVKFRDPEGHPLEFLQFPSGGGGRWDELSAAPGPLGVDHSAISVSDADQSAAFYSRLGLHQSDRTLNHGATQVALDGLGDVEVDVVPLHPRRPAPHLELLGYRSPRGRPNLEPRSNDVAATRLVWASDRDGVLSDPDGHLHQLLRDG